MGPRTHLTASEACAIEEYLSSREALRDLALFLTAVDSMLRCSDLLALRVRDVQAPGGGVRDRLQIGQQKTRSTVHPALTQRTRKALDAWLKHSGKCPGDFLFTSLNAPHGPALSHAYYRERIKAWVEAIGLDRTNYSSHSLRRTKPVWMWRHGDRRVVTITVLQLLLGHKSPESTIRYLGLDVLEVQDIALSHDLFASGSPSPRRRHMKK
ncbi:MAG: tyrosine-type recombinase/integrase [Burkholderiaceae bacterium]